MWLWLAKSVVDGAVETALSSAVVVVCTGKSVIRRGRVGADSSCSDSLHLMGCPDK